MQDTEQQHRDQRDRGGKKVDPADPPHAHKCCDIDELVDRGEDNSRQHRLGQIGQESREESRQIASVTEQMTSASGVFAPAWSLTADCDSPPATG